MSHLNRHRHQLRRFVTSITKHQPLITRTARVNALSDIRRLCADSVDDATGIRIVAEFGVVVADLFDSFANYLLIIDLGRSGDLTRNDCQTGGYERFASNSSGRVLCQNSVENGVRDMIRDLIWMAFRDLLRCE